MADIALLLVAIVVLVSSIQMEVTGGEPFMGMSFMTYTILHIVLAVSMMLLIAYHLYLHFNWKNWIEKLRQTPKKQTRVLAVLAGLVLLTGVASLVDFMIHLQHTPLGGLHGKIGFIFMIIAIGHTLKRKKFLNK